MYFRLGGGTLKGISKPGEIVWSRIFVDDGELKADLGRAEVVELPREETERRWQITTPQWPIMHAVTRGVSRDQMMARHKANHIQVAYAPDWRRRRRSALAGEGRGVRTNLGIDVSDLRRDAGGAVRVGIIGTGAISHKHAQAYRNIGYEIAACTDIDAGPRPGIRRTVRRRVRSRRGEESAAIRTSISSMSAPFRISGCSRSKLCAITKKHVQVQKPIATNLETAREMVDDGARRAGSCSAW